MRDGNSLRYAACFFLAALAVGFTSCNDLGGPIGWPTYTIVYHYHDDTGNPRRAYSVRRYGTNQELKNVERVRHDFLGWAITPGLGAPYGYWEPKNGESVRRLVTRVGDTINLYARWNPYTFTVIYNANRYADDTEYIEREYTFTINARLSPIQIEFTPPPDLPFFGGWATSPEGPPEFGNDCGCGANCNCGDACNNYCTFFLRNIPLQSSGSIRLYLYARWVAGNNFTITFDFNGGENAVGGDSEKKENEPAGRLIWLPNEFGFDFPFSKQDYVFAGWNTYADGSGNSFSAGGRFIPIDNITLFAQWKPIGTTFTVTFDANGATEGSPPPPQHVSAGNLDTKLPGVGGLLKPGYHFVGWSTQPSGPWASFPENYPFRPTANTTLYARWERSEIHWIAVPFGSPTTTAINFVFASPVEELDEGNITIGGSPGAVVTGSLTGTGTSRSLEVTAVTSPGEITVSITRPGIATGAQTITVLAHQMPEPDTPWVAIARGFPRTVAIDFVFAFPVEDLYEGDITIGGSLGVIETGLLTGAGTSRSLAVTDVTNPGDISVSIARPGIVTGSQTVRILDYQVPVPDIPWVAIARGVPTNTIDFVFASPVVDLDEGDITIGGGPGAIVTGILSGTGASRSLAVSAVTDPGEITVSIARSGIVAESQTVTILAGQVLPEPDTPWVAIARGFPYTVAIDFAFAFPVDGLAVADIYVAGGTGAVTPGVLTGSGIFRSLAVTVTNPGTVSVSITRPGIAAGPQTVTVLDEHVPDPDIPWVAIARGFPYTTAIDFVFAFPVGDLNEGDITITGGPGVITRGGLSGAGTSRSLAVSAVTNPGDINVAIARSGIAAGPQTVTVLDYQVPDPDISWVAIARGFPLTTAIDFAFVSPVDGLLTDGDIIVTGVTGGVAIGGVTGTGAFRSLVVNDVTNPGTVSVSIVRSGIAAGPQTVTVLDEPVPIPDIPWVAIAQGFPLTTSIDFAFADTVDGLTVADIYVTGGTGAATPGVLTGSGIFWSLVVTVANPGTVSVSIARSGIAADPQTVTILDERPPRDITISFADFQDTAPHIIGPTFGILGSSTITVLDPGGQFASIEWWRGGTPLGTGEVLTLNSVVHGNRIGVHYVTVIVRVYRNGELVPYSRIVRFEVRLN